jgi:hypothetical protein
MILHNLAILCLKGLGHIKQVKEFQDNGTRKLKVNQNILHVKYECLHAIIKILSTFLENTRVE